MTMIARSGLAFSITQRSSRSLGLLARLAVFAVLLNALAPMVTAMLAAHDPVGFDTLCSAQRTSDDGAPASGSHPRNSCGYCVTHAGSFALAVPFPAASDLLVFVPPRPELNIHAAAPATPRWHTAQPRAPPLA